MHEVGFYVRCNLKRIKNLFTYVRVRSVDLFEKDTKASACCNKRGVNLVEESLKEKRSGGRWDRCY
jgi:hypothetical protein